jgi:hypothetical protein
MTKTFANYPELTSELMFDLIDRVNALAIDDVSVSLGASNQSCSRYVSVRAEEADEEFKVRFSDHADRYGSDITIRIDDLVEVIEDDGEFVNVTIEDWRYADALNRGEAAVRSFLAGLEA